MAVLEPKTDDAPWSRPTKYRVSNASSTVAVSHPAPARLVVVARLTAAVSLMAVSVQFRRLGQQPVLVDHLLERGDPVVVVLPLPAGVGGRALPVADRLDEALLELAPLVVAELGQRQCEAERASLPLVFELWCRLIGGAGVVQLHDAGPASATPIMDSVVTRSISISSVKSSVPVGRSGITNQRECPLLSQTLISVSSGSSTPTSAST